MKTREEEITQKAKEIALNWDDGRGNVFYHRVDMLCNMAQWADSHPKNPWITDEMPEDIVLQHKNKSGIRITNVVLCKYNGKYIVDYRRYINGEWMWDTLEGCEVECWMPIPKND